MFALVVASFVTVDPPTMPPVSSSTSAPGLFTSNDQITVNCVSEENPHGDRDVIFDVLVHGVDVVLDWVGIGTMGDDSATVSAGY